MNTGAKFVIAVVAIGGVMAAQRALVPSMSQEMVVIPEKVRGTVVSVETAVPGAAPKTLKAVVKLDSGETVEAEASPACLILPGQTAEMAKFGGGAFVSTKYVVLAGGK